jgi:hypothetical protein
LEKHYAGHGVFLLHGCRSMLKRSSQVEPALQR